MKLRTFHTKNKRAGSSRVVSVLGSQKYCCEKCRVGTTIGDIYRYPFNKAAYTSTPIIHNTYDSSARLEIPDWALRWYKSENASNYDATR